MYLFLLTLLTETVTSALDYTVTVYYFKALFHLSCALLHYVDTPDYIAYS